MIELTSILIRSTLTPIQLKMALHFLLKSQTEGVIMYDVSSIAVEYMYDEVNVHMAIKDIDRMGIIRIHRKEGDDSIKMGGCLSFIGDPERWVIQG